MGVVVTGDPEIRLELCGVRKRGYEGSFESKRG